MAFQNALYRLLHAESFEEGVVETVMEGYDSDTNAAICGALLGSVYGIESVPEQWRHAVLNCRLKRAARGFTGPGPKNFGPLMFWNLRTSWRRTLDADIYFVQSTTPTAMITIDFTEISGHILVPVAYGQALIDTGSPGSFAPAPFQFAGREYAPPAAMACFSPERLSELSGIQIDA